MALVMFERHRRRTRRVSQEKILNETGGRYQLCPGNQD